jgi:hypothetical protein
MQLELFNNIYKDIFSHSHECISYNIYDMHFDVIQFLIQNDYISIEKKPNTFYVIDIIVALFHEFSRTENLKSRLKEYIDYFWNFIVEKNAFAIINYVNEKNNYTIINYILNSNDKSIQLTYTNKYIDLWNHFYPDEEVNSVYNVYIQLALDNNVEVLKKLFLRKSYNSNMYEWNMIDYDNKNINSISLICFLLKENYYIRDVDKIQNLANTIKILIEYGNIKENKQILMEYINNFNYNYSSSPIMKIFEDVNFENVDFENVDFENQYVDNSELKRYMENIKIM